MPERCVLVLAGGRGERFWPWSRPERPKQLLPLATGGKTLLATTLERARALVPPERVLVMTSRDLKAAVARECEPLGIGNVVGEPVMRNTAAAIGAAATWWSERLGDPAFAVMPADHAIEDRAAFVADLKLAFDLAEREKVLVTFGIRPTFPNTSFGYVHMGPPVAERVRRADRFTEKPDLEHARAWVESGEYLWNSGIFVWRCSSLLNELESQRPKLANPLRHFADAKDAAALERKLDDVFPALESISIDYAVLEKAPQVLLIEATFDWDDLGSWSAWARRQPRDDRGNVLFGDAVAVECDRCIVVGDGGTAAALKLSDMVVVNAGGSTLACRIADSDQVRRVSEAVRARGGT